MWWRSRKARNSVREFDIYLRKFNMENDEIHYKEWRIEVLHGELGWKALVYRPSSPLHELEVPNSSDRRATIEDARALIDKLIAA